MGRPSEPEPIEKTLRVGAAATREQLLALTPSRYLAGGFRDERGVERAELTSLWALAAAEQLREAGVTPADFEVAAGVAASALSAPPARPGTAPDEPLREALGACSASREAKAFLGELLYAVKESADVPALAHHVGTVLRTLALKHALAATTR